MARIVFGMNQTLDGYINHEAFDPSPALFRHFLDQALAQAGCLYGRRVYEVMRSWDTEDPDWSPEERAYAIAWQHQRKWVVSRSLDPVGPNAELVAGDLETVVRQLKADHDGDIEVAGPELASHLTDLGLIDEYLIYLHPVALGQGKPYFAGPPPKLRLLSQDRIDEYVVRLAYVPV